MDAAGVGCKGRRSRKGSVLGVYLAGVTESIKVMTAGVCQVILSLEDQQVS